MLYHRTNNKVTSIVMNATCINATSIYIESATSTTYDQAIFRHMDTFDKTRNNFMDQLTKTEHCC